MYFFWSEIEHMQITFMANIIDAFVLIFGKTGKFLNARGNRICFLIELCCLSYWMIVDIQRGLFSQAISCCVSMGISIYGYINWGKKKPITQN